MFYGATTPRDPSFDGWRCGARGRPAVHSGLQRQGPGRLRPPAVIKVVELPPLPVLAEPHDDSALALRHDQALTLGARAGARLPRMPRSRHRRQRTSPASRASHVPRVLQPHAASPESRYRQSAPARGTVGPVRAYRHHPRGRRASSPLPARGLTACDLRQPAPPRSSAPTVLSCVDTVIRRCPRCRHPCRFRRGRSRGRHERFASSYYLFDRDRRAHDDVANAMAGALLLASDGRRRGLGFRSDVGEIRIVSAHRGLDLPTARDVRVRQF
jgi:hypothetical protein